VCVSVYVFVCVNIYLDGGYRRMYRSQGGAWSYGCRVDVSVAIEKVDINENGLNDRAEPKHQTCVCVCVCVCV
jgi:hypothetical protein